MDSPSRSRCMFSIALHGGAGVIPLDIDGAPFRIALTEIVTRAHEYATSLIRGAAPINDKAAVDVAEYTVKLLEDCELFNAGKGAVYANNGLHELEASIMDGRTLDCGAASLLSHVKNPIALARVVMENTHHVYMVGEGAETVARKHGLEMVENEYFNTERRWQQFRKARDSQMVARDHDISISPPDSPSPTSTPSITPFSSERFVSESDLKVPRMGQRPVMMNDGGNTVGCVVMFNGHVAAATSTGGLTNKLPGRVGDTPIIGAGTYANDQTCAISATGMGEEFIRRVVGYDTSCLMRYANLSLKDAVSTVVRTSLPEGSGGVIAVDGTGSVVMDFNSTGMFRAACDSEGHFCIGIYAKNEPLDCSASLPASLRHLRNVPPRMRRSMADLTIAAAEVEGEYEPTDWLEYSTVVPHPDNMIQNLSQLVDQEETKEGSENGESQ